MVIPPNPGPTQNPRFLPSSRIPLPSHLPSSHPNLTVILLSRANRGQLSDKRYDSGGYPAGVALKSGTPAPIPDLDPPREKINIRVP